MKNILFVFLFGLILSSAVYPQKESRMMTQPAVSQKNIAFIYANDLWISDLDGQNIKRLTVDSGIESNPVFSPDGKLIAFSAQYDANTDVYVIPVEGGVPIRLTYHPNADIVMSFTPDGKEILFTSTQNSFISRVEQFFTVPIEGGMPKQLPIPSGNNGSYSSDGKMFTYNPFMPAFTQWKNYRGGRVSVIWIMKLSDNSIEKVEQPKERCNDFSPKYGGDIIYFLSDRKGEFNLYSYDPRSKSIKQLTYHKDFPILNYKVGKESIIYEQAGYLHLYNIAEGKSRKLEINIGADLPFVRSRYVKGNNYVRSFEISPTGARAVFNLRGEIVTVPAEKGDPRNITNTIDVNERTPSWSPDAKYISYFSDESGEYQLHIKSQDGKGEAKKYKLTGGGFYDLQSWSPDNQKILYRDNSQSIYWLDIKTGQCKKIVSQQQLSIRNTLMGNWSSDSKWIVYTRETRAYLQVVYVYSLEQDKSFQITDELSDVSEPVFDKSGKYIYFLGSSNAGPSKQWFELGYVEAQTNNNIYFVTLRKDIPNPIEKESDEEKIVEKKEGENKNVDKDIKKEEINKKKKEAEFTIDFENIKNRIMPLPIAASEYTNLTAGNEGEIYYLEIFKNIGKIKKYDLKKRKEETLLEKGDYFILSEDRTKIFYLAGNSYFITTTAPKIEAGKGRLNLEAVDIFIEPLKEWKQIFTEAWRFNSDLFYDPNMHGVDWKAMKDKYSVFLDYLTCRQDLNRVIQWMCSELSVGHHRVNGGDFFIGQKNVNVGLLGADYIVENGKYRFKKIYGGLNWNPTLRAPLSEPGVDVKTGDYLLAVNGTEITYPENLYKYFENTANKITEIKVGPNPDGTGSKIVTVVPVQNEAVLRHIDWVEGNIQKVHEATNGKVAYVYVPDTSISGYESFKRYFYPQADKEAIIVDERFNSGGLVADYYTDILRKEFICYWGMRYGDDLVSPNAAILGPKVLIQNEMAGSGGDLLPYMWRKFKLGPIVGKRTWGGLVGSMNPSILMDGGFVTNPNVGIWTDEGWIIENEGVPADIEVEQTPSEVLKGKDPQLEKAIQVALDELKKNPVKKPKRAPIPERSKR
jgi:tricorn protease